MLNEIEKYIEIIDEKLGNKVLEVGFFAEDKYPNKYGTQVAEVAVIQEYGSPANNIPPRPFMRPALEDNINKWNKSFEKNQDFDKLGNIVVEDIKKEIKNIFDPPLSLSTLRNRSLRGNFSTKPLIDTSKMIDSVKYKIEN